MRLILFSSVFAFTTSVLANETPAPFARVSLVFGEQAHCDRIVDAVKQMEVRVDGLPERIDAGSKLEFKLQLKSHTTLNAENWLVAESQVRVVIDIKKPYPKALRLEAFPDLKAFVFSAEPEQEFTIQLDIPETLDGNFDVSLSVAAVDNEMNYCIVRGSFGKKLAVHSTTPDVTPPLLRGLAFDKPKYARGDEALVQIKLTEALAKPETNHLDFVNHELDFSDGGRWFPGYLSESVYHLEDLGAGEYVARFKVPEGVKSGRYFFEWFNREDTHGNFEAALGRDDEEELVIVKANPLVVE